MNDTSTNRVGVIKLWLLNLVANAVVLAVWYFWLVIPDAHGWQVAASALIGFAVVVGVLWLRAGTLAWFRMEEFRKQERIAGAYRRSLRYIPALAFWVLLFIVVAWLLWDLRLYLPQTAVWIRQKLNGGPSPRNIANDLNWLLLAVIFYVMPALWLPIAATVSATGVHPQHLARSRRVWKRPLYWLWLAIVLAVGLWVPCKLVWWVPELQSVRQQAWSMSARFGLAYFIGVTAFLAVVWIAGAHTDREDPLVTGPQISG